MAGVEIRDFTAPEETRTPGKTTVELVSLAGGQIGRYTFEPGWHWSVHKAVVGTDSCQVEHIGYVVSGRLHIQHEDGSEDETAPGDIYRIAPGHDAWVVGDEPAVFLEFQGAANYAKADRRRGASPPLAIRRDPVLGPSTRRCYDRARPDGDE